MKKILTATLLFCAALSANAQFEKGKTYLGASISGMGMSYSSNEKFRFGADVEAGYFLAECLLLRANVGYEHTRAIDDIRAGLGARYYFSQNGIYMGAGAEYNHFTPNNNDVLIPLELGYAFFLNGHITLEPALHYKMSLHDFSGNSTFGFRIGLGYYF